MRILPSVTGLGTVAPSTGTWYLRNEASAGAPDAGQLAFGAPGWVPVVGDWTGSGHDGVGVVDPSTSTWYLRNEVSTGAPDAGQFAFGTMGMVPVVGHWTASPAFTSAAGATFTAASAGNFAVTAGGYPAPTLSENSTDILPGGVYFDPSTGLLSGSPAPGSVGTYELHFTAHNGADPDATQTFTLTVATNVPIVTWAPSARISVGTPLSAAQLDATANTPGTFTYTPAAGSVLSSPGLHVLSVTFTPADYADFATVTATATIIVTPAPPASSSVLNLIARRHVVARHGIASLKLISVSDHHAPRHLHVHISATAGELRMKHQQGVRITGIGSNTMDLTGTRAAINRALRGLSLSLVHARTAIVTVTVTGGKDTCQTTIKVV
jgi:hypothetical protein